MTFMIGPKFDIEFLTNPTVSRSNMSKN